MRSVLRSYEEGYGRHKYLLLITVKVSFSICHYSYLHILLPTDMKQSYHHPTPLTVFLAEDCVSEQ